MHKSWPVNFCPKCLVLKYLIFICMVRKNCSLNVILLSTNGLICIVLIFVLLPKTISATFCWQGVDCKFKIYPTDTESGMELNEDSEGPPLSQNFLLHVLIVKTGWDRAVIKLFPLDFFKVTSCPDRFNIIYDLRGPTSPRIHWGTGISSMWTGRPCQERVSEHCECPKITVNWMWKTTFSNLET